MVFYQSLSDSKFLQVSMTLLGILADLNDVLVWMVSAYPLIFNSSSPLTKLLGTVPTVPITIGTTATFMFHVHVFYFSGKIQVVVSLFIFFDIHSVVLQDGTSDYKASSLFIYLFIYLFIFFFYCHLVWSSGWD